MRHEHDSVTFKDSQLQRGQPFGDGFALNAQLNDEEAQLVGKIARAQALEALSYANEIRLARADIKRRLRDGSLSLDAAFDLDEVQTMHIGKLLMATKGIGTAKASKMLRRARVSPSRPVNLLGPVERRLLAEWKRR